jgi:putative ABC transport system substrate-binding protein
MISGTDERTDGGTALRNRNVGVVALSLGFLVVAGACNAQTPSRTPRIGYIGLVQGGASLFAQAMGELNYVEGRTLEMVVRISGDRPESLPGLARELVQERVDVIVAASAPAIRAAKDATTTIPIVMGFVAGDPVKAGFVESYARPGGNVTGVAMIADETVGKRLEFVKELLPDARRVAVLAIDNPLLSGPQIDAMQRAAPVLGLETVIVRVRGPQELDDAIADAATRAQALLMLSSPPFAAHRRRIADLAVKHRLPMVCDWQELVDAGCLLAYGPGEADLLRRVARVVDRIVKGARPETLPVERSDTFELAINRDTAARVGVTVPQAMLLRARTVP